MHRITNLLSWRYRPAGLLFCLLIAPPTMAQESAATHPNLKDLVGRVDLAVPEATAFAVLGVTPQKVMRPTSGKDLAIGLLSGVDSSGNAQPGLALDTRPWMLAFGDSLTLDEYRANTLKRQLARMRLSLATTAGQSDADKADRYALGLSFTPWDAGDPRNDEVLRLCYNTKLAVADDEPPPPPLAGLTPAQAKAVIDAVTAKRDKELTALALACVKEAEKRNWNAGAWEIGIAGYREDTGGPDESGGAAWTSLSVPVTQAGQFIVHGRMQSNELVADTKASSGYRVQDSWLAGARLRIGNDRGSLMLEGSYSDIAPDNAKRFNNAYLATGVEYRLAPGLWFQLVLGDTYGDNPDDNDTVVSGQLRWGWSENRLFAQP